MKRILSLAGLFALTCLIGVALSGVMAENAGACWTCGGYTCDYPSSCSPVTPRLVRTLCEDGCCQEPTPYVLYQCAGKCTGFNNWCDCVKVGCWEGLHEIEL